jgi:hypothetical protein
VYACEDPLETFENDDYLPELQSVTDSDVNSECFNDPDLDDFAGMPGLGVVSDSEDEEDSSIPGDSNSGVDEPIDSSESENRPTRQNQSMPFLRHGFLLSAVRNTKHSMQKVEPDINMLE